MSNIKKHL